MEPPSEAAEAVVSSDAAISPEAVDPSEEAVVSSKASIDEQLREELKDELHRLIKRWKVCAREPPFTVEELVVIAVFLGPRRGSTQMKVLHFITQHFSYYTNLAIGCSPLAQIKTLKMYPQGAVDKMETFQTQCDLVYRQSEVPIESDPSARPHLARWTITCAAARIFLDDRLRPSKDQKPFPLMRLPAELRNRVYELVLQIPSQGVLVKVKTHKPGKEPVGIPAQLSVMKDPEVGFGQISFYIGLADAYYDPPFERTPDFLPEKTLLCRPAAAHLALLQVSKQIFQESMPVFYSCNNFIFDNVKHLLWFLEATPSARRNHIEHVSFFFHEGDEKFAGPAFKLLKEIPHLRELDIDVQEDGWKRASKFKSGELKYPDVLKVPGVFTLRSIRGLDAVRLHGDCETFKTLVPEMTSEKKEKKAPVKRPKKRKAQADAEYVEPVEDAANSEDSPDQSAPPKKKVRKSKKSKTT